VRIDSHVHSSLSPDSSIEPTDAIRLLAREGLGCCFTDHVDYVVHEAGQDTGADDAPRAEADFIMRNHESHPLELLKYRGEGVFIGVEVGLNRAFLQANEEIGSREGLDYTVGSVHYVDGWGIHDNYFKNYRGDHYRRMLEYAREMVELNGYIDSLGHIDYISRYSPLAEKNVLYSNYPDEYDALFAALASRDMALEINTQRFGDPKAEACAYQVYKRFRARGGRFVTIGSDAHTHRELGRYYKRALKMARETGLSVVCHRGHIPQKSN